MAVSASFRQYVLEQLGRVGAVSARAMFGGVGLYLDGLFFGLLAEDRVYLKTGESNRGDFERAGMGPFIPFGGDKPMKYYELPGELLEDPDQLRPWIEKAVQVAREARRGKSTR